MGFFNQDIKLLIYFFAQISSLYKETTSDLLTTLS